MIGFSQWWRSFNKSKKVFPHYYLLGKEAVLKDEIIQSIKREHEVQEWNQSGFVVGVIPEVEIWERLYSSSIDGSNLLTVVRDAEKLKNLHLIPDLVKSKPKNHVIIFVSNELEMQKELVEIEDSRKWELPEFLRTFEKQGKVIECQPFTQSTAKTAVQWLKTKVKAQDGAIVHLLNETNGDMRAIRDVILKLQWMKETATVKNIDIMLHDHRVNTFLDSLVALEKETAMLALEAIPEKDYLQLIGRLDAQIDLANKVNIFLKQHKTVPEIMKIIGAQAFLVPAISKVARNYSSERVVEIRKLIAEADRRLRRNQVEGVMEALVVMW